MNPPTTEINSFRDLQAYRLACELQDEIFQHSKLWPREETYSLTDQIRRSARSIGANLAEAWAKRRYPAHFLSKLTDADGELQETHHWLATARSAGYLKPDRIQNLEIRFSSLGKMLGAMIAKHEKFCVRGDKPVDQSSSRPVDRHPVKQPINRSTGRPDAPAFRS